MLISKRRPTPLAVCSDGVLFLPHLTAIITRASLDAVHVAADVAFFTGQHIFRIRLAKAVLTHSAELHP
jgi:hypothetical protein